jgi:hypothetical protein
MTVELLAASAAYKNSAKGASDFIKMTLVAINDRKGRESHFAIREGQAKIRSNLVDFVEQALDLQGENADLQDRLRAASASSGSA